LSNGFLLCFAKQQRWRAPRRLQGLSRAWSDRMRYGYYFKEKRRALHYLEEEEDEEGGAKAACYSAEAAFSQVGDLHCNPVVLQEVCKYLIGHSLYVSLVCKSWKHCYEIAAAQSEPAFAVVPDDDDNGDDSDVDSTQDDNTKEKRVGAANITLYQAAFCICSYSEVRLL
jgi:uncharacterized protein YbcC (UPF0753/DUF2309 family)